MWTINLGTLALDKSERVLRDSYNSSLKDFSTKPELVMNVMNGSLAATDFTGLRAGRIFYSSRLEFDNETIWAGQHVNCSLRLTHRMRFNSSGMDIEETAEILWNTKSGRPPKDLSTMELQVYRYPDVAVYLAVTVACLLTAYQCSIGVVAYRFKRNETKKNS